MLAVLVVVVAVSYILFAPSTMWKPVYIRFEESAAAEPAPSEAPPTAQAPQNAALMIPYRPGSGIMYDLGTKIVNLAEPGGRRYLQVGVVLECLPLHAGYYQLEGAAREEAETEALAELEALKPVLDDAVIGLLTSRTFAEIFTVEGKDRLKDELVAKVNGLLGRDQVAGVYFTEFLVQ